MPSSVYQPQNVVPKIVFSDALLAKPVETEITDSTDIEMRTMGEMNLNPFSTLRPKSTKRREAIATPAWMLKQTGAIQKPSTKGFYVEYNAVDSSVPGMNFVMLCQPDLQPDDVVMFAPNPTVPDLEILDIATTMFRVREVSHRGETEYFDEWTTEIKTSVYDPVTGDELGGII